MWKLWTPVTRRNYALVVALWCVKLFVFVCMNVLNATSFFNVT
jgi:hypothetical protein